MEQSCFVDRELSWLQFNLRVLKEADDKSLPVLERVKFLSIYSTNLDEFYMVRIGSLMHHAHFMPDFTDQKTGWDIPTELKKITQEVQKQQEKLEKSYKRILADLAANSIDVLDFKHISKLDASVSKKVFSEVKQFLSPQILDIQRPLPFLWNQEQVLVAQLEKNGKQFLGSVSLERLPRFRMYEMNGRQKVIVISELINAQVKNVFKGYTVKENVILRVTRNADVFMDDIERYNALAFRKNVERLLRKRKRELPVRLQVEGKCSAQFQELLRKKVGIEERYVTFSGIPLVCNFDTVIKARPEMKFGERHPTRNVRLNKGEFFSYLEKHDLLLSYPYQSMKPFIDLLYEAADDPSVQSIKITLYRLAASSKVAAALAYAADKGKDVLCLLELRARFDEQNNIDYSEMLEDAGCKVIYGLPDYKVHCKLCLITRNTGGEENYITQVGTGNYNEVTCEQYCDLSMITSDKDVGLDAEKTFAALEAGTLPVKTKTLWVAPYSFKYPLLELMEQERKKGTQGYIAMKVNSMNDWDIMNKIIQCSQAGVTVELMIRGICCLLPGIPGQTEHVTVSSVIGRYLEHSRIFVFGKDSHPRMFIGSGDLLSRNTQRRVEALIEVKEPALREQVTEILNAFRADREKQWFLQPDGSYRKRERVENTASQDRLYQYFEKQTVEANVTEGFWKRFLTWWNLRKKQWFSSK